MGRLQALVILGVAAAAGGPAEAQWWSDGAGPGTRVGVSVEVEGRRAALYPAPDEGRFYLEARAGARYAVSLTNRTRERLGVVLTVDGLNAISGQRDAGIGRMYVLGPWEQTTVRGWRSSLADVRQFTFVDERSSYAARAGKANGHLGWIEVAVFREQRVVAARPCGRPWCGDRPLDRTMEPEARASERDEEGRAARKDAERSAGAAAPPASEAEAGRDRDDKAESHSGELYRPAPAAPSARSFPGTGWGDRAYDPVTLVDFRAEPAAVERLTLRYEYAGALRALGILPTPYYPSRDRLGERERGDLGFARPPAW